MPKLGAERATIQVMCIGAVLVAFGCTRTTAPEPTFQGTWALSFHGRSHIPGVPIGEEPSGFPVINCDAEFHFQLRDTTWKVYDSVGVGRRNPGAAGSQDGGALSCAAAATGAQDSTWQGVAANVAVWKVDAGVYGIDLHDHLSGGSTDMLVGLWKGSALDGEGELNAFSPELGWMSFYGTFEMRRS